MTEVQLALLAMQGTKLAIEAIVNAYNRQEMTDEELLMAWGAMKLRLRDVSARIEAD